MNIFTSLLTWWKSHTFNGKIEREVGTVDCESGSMDSQQIKILLLEPKPPLAGRRVELQLIMKAPLGYQNTPICLSQDQVENLIQVLREAIA